MNARRPTSARRRGAARRGAPGSRSGGGRAARRESARQGGHPATSSKPARAAGVLLHPTSLPGRFPIGDLGPAAYAFLDWLAEAGLSSWQVLPLGPTGYGNSPYTALSAFAGNPLLVSPELLERDGLVTADDVAEGERTPSPTADLEAARSFKQRILSRGWERFRAQAPGDLTLQWMSFRESVETAWLADWALYSALKEAHQGRAWIEWDEELRSRRKGALVRARRELAGDIELRCWEQFLFFRQWASLRAAAEARGIVLIGDVPIYPALDSADVWAHRELFAVRAGGELEGVAGVPPDYFSVTGQRWGNPLFRWERLAAQGYDWWIARVRAQLRLCHILRLDHFRGFASFWRVPAGAATAAKGRWVKGPGRALFSALRRALGDLPLLAEDLGQIDDVVHELRRELGLPGMRVLQFGFDEPDSLHAPHRHEPDAVVYTGTHDNDTCRGWFDAASQEVRQRVLDYLGATPEALPWAMCRAALTSVASLAILPIQDLLGLGSSSRMNTPGRESGNWTFRVLATDVPPDLSARLRALVDVSGRARI